MDGVVYIFVIATLTLLNRVQACIDDKDASFCENKIKDDPSICDTNSDFRTIDCCKSCKEPHWGPWAAWSACSVSCGDGGKQTTVRDCHNPNAGLVNGGCDGTVREKERDCTPPPIDCPVHGNWGPWRNVGDCTKNCGGGQQKRERVCDNPAPANGGNKCQGEHTDTVGCNDHKCSVHGNWGRWRDVGDCTKNCGGGQQKRERVCDNPAPANGGNKCQGEHTDTVGCNDHKCSVQGNWGPWRDVGDCTKTCGGGQQKRQRVCDNPAPANGGKKCQGEHTDTVGCNDHKCSVHGNWGPWRDVGDCTKTCGGGQQKRQRVCDNPVPANGGNKCQGEHTDTVGCNDHKCSVYVCEDTIKGCDVFRNSKSCEMLRSALVGKCDQTCGYCTAACKDTIKGCDTFKLTKSCELLRSSLIGKCDKTCGFCVCEDTMEGCEHLEPVCSQIKHLLIGKCDKTCRLCAYPKRATTPVSTTTPTTTTPTTTRAATTTTKHIIVDGNWGMWGPWRWLSTTQQQNTRSANIRIEPCSGIQVSNRFCNNPSPQNGGKSCTGPAVRYRTHPRKCDGGWSSWSVYGSCSTSCGIGTKTRTRVCNNPTPAHGGAACIGAANQLQICVLRSCAVNGGWSSWSVYGSCSTSCGIGTQTRTRVCDNPTPAHGGAACIGAANQLQICVLRSCPAVDGCWGQWSPYGACSTTCGEGVRSRRRNCDSPVPENGGSKCTGQSSQHIPCCVQIC